MTANVHHNIFRIKSSLRDAADPRRSNSTLTLNDYCSVALGIISLCHDLSPRRLISREVEVAA
jgi:hypothetical protein